MFKDLEAAESGFSGIAAHMGFGANLAQDGETVAGTATLVSGSYFAAFSGYRRPWGGCSARPTTRTSASILSRC
ncbi:MAG TPA: hypothetical protein QGG47_13595 [Acidobacteriota bacterium]|nr:hypothetical protein [Acidobacteriota bacterium]